MATSKADLRLLVRMGDVEAGVELIDRCHIKTLKGLLANVCQFDCELTPAIFDAAADAWALVQRREELQAAKA